MKPRSPLADGFVHPGSSSAVVVVAAPGVAVELQARRLRLDVSTDLHLNASVREADKAMPYASQLGLADGGGYRHLEPCAPLRP